MFNNCELTALSFKQKILKIAFESLQNKFQ